MSMRALRQLTEHADHQHRAAMSTLAGDPATAGPISDDSGSVAERRRFVRNLGLGGSAIAFGALLVPVAGLMSEAAAQTTKDGTDIPAGDVALVVFAQGLELAAQSLYEQMEQTGKLRGQSLASVRLFGRHHEQHAAAIALLQPKANVVSDPNPKVVALFSPRIAGAADDKALMQIAFEIETGMASTHQLSMERLANFQSATVMATIEPIEAQHAVVWGQTLELPIDQWMPAFQTTAAALDPTTFAAS